MIETFDDEELLEKRVKLFSTFSKESTLVDTGILSKKVSDDRKKLKFLFFQVSFDNFVKDSYLWNLNALLPNNVLMNGNNSSYFYLLTKKQTVDSQLFNFNTFSTLNFYKSVSFSDTENNILEYGRKYFIF